jgi:hypothetical protein
MNLQQRRTVDSAIADLEEPKNHGGGNVLRQIQIHLATVESKKSR